MKILGIAFVVLLAGCSKDTGNEKTSNVENAGKERSPCYGNGTCDKGLECLSDLCVKPVKTDLELALEEEAKAVAALAKLKADMAAAQAKIDAAQERMDQAFRDLKNSRTESDRAAAIELRKSAKEELAKQRDALQTLNEEGLKGLSVKGRTPLPDPRNTEAQQFLYKMAESARIYYSTPGLGAATALTLAPDAMEKHFPASVGITPSLGTCCKDGGIASRLLMLGVQEHGKHWTSQ